MKRFKKAGITLEFTIGILLTAVVLIYGLRMFNNNVATLVQGSNFQRLFHGEGRGKYQSDYQTYQTDPKAYNIQGLSGEADGLTYWSETALSEIAKLYEESKKRALTDAEIKDLAKWATIMSVADKQGQAKPVPGTDKTVYGVLDAVNTSKYNNSGIYIKVLPSNITTLNSNGESINWSRIGNEINDTKGWTALIVRSEDDKKKVEANIQFILKAFN